MSSPTGAAVSPPRGIGASVTGASDTAAGWGVGIGRGGRVDAVSAVGSEVGSTLTGRVVGSGSTGAGAGVGKGVSGGFTGEGVGAATPHMKAPAEEDGPAATDRSADVVCPGISNS